MEKNVMLKSRILIVDDQQANVDVVVDFLEIQGYTNVVSLTDPRKVLAALRAYPPDLILLDLTMPYLSGFDILEQLKSEVNATDYLPVLVLTADVNVETKRKALLSGASDFIIKPFDLIELQARVNAHLQIRFKNEQIKQYSRQLEELIATKDKFFSIIAHDIRNPFAGIENYIRIMLKTGSVKNADECTADLQRIYNTAHQGHELLENLLKWSRSQTGKIELNEEEFQLVALIHGCIKSSAMQATDKGIKLDTDIDSDIVVNVDSDVFNTVFRNLISNAVKFTNAGGTVLVSAKMVDKSIVIKVIDDGVGISEQDRETLFAIGKNVQSRKGTEGESGSGLGLILCADFVKLLGGTINVESKVGAGTTVSVSLPYRG